MDFDNSSSWSSYPEEDTIEDSNDDLLFFYQPLSSQSLQCGGTKKCHRTFAGSQGCIYTAKDHTCFSNEGKPRNVIVKELFKPESFYGAAGIDPALLRESGLLQYIKEKHQKIAFSSVVNKQYDLDSTAGVAELYRVLEGPFNTFYLVLEAGATDMRQLTQNSLLESSDSSSVDEGDQGYPSFTWKTVAKEIGTIEDSEGDNEELPPISIGLTMPDPNDSPSILTEQERKPHLLDLGVSHNISKEERVDNPSKGAEESKSLPPPPQLPLFRYLARRLLRILWFLHHTCHICHRDFKLSNLVVLKSGDIRLVDFGSACFLSELQVEQNSKADSEEAITQRAARTPSTLRTTKGYVAPECLLNQGYDTSIDIWAAGISLLEILLQRPLFQRTVDIDIFHEICIRLFPSFSPAYLFSSSFLKGNSCDAQLGNDEASEVKAPSGLVALLDNLLPPEGLTFLQSLLSFEAKHRPTAKEALDDPFLTFPGWEEDDEMVLKREEPFYFYKLLGISTKASQQEIRTAYRSKALSVHPDKNDGHEDMFLVVKEAYDTLSNIPKRCAYDREQSGLPKLPRVVGFKRPPPLPSVVAGISYVLPDGMPYVFETAPSVLRCGLTHGDMLGWDDETGYFVGMAGDNCWWWCKGNSDVAIKLCDPSSSMMRSRITVLSHTKRMARYTGSKPFVRLSSTMGPRSSTGKGSCDSLSDRQKGMNGLERMRQEIIREGQMKARLRAKESLLRDEMSLRKMRTESWIEALQELHQRFQSIKLRLKLFLAPTEGEWDALFAEARAPSTPLYAKPASVVPKTSASHVDPTGRQRSCSTSSSSSSCSPHAKSDSSTECKGASIEIAMKAVKPTSSSKEAAMLSQRSKTESEKATRKSTVKMKKTGSISTQEEPKKMSSGH